MQCNYEKIRKKSAKKNLGKKSAKRLTLSRAAGDLGVVTSFKMFEVV
jgi:hypothetical protein